MSYIIKQIPEDFIVEEENNILLTKEGNYLYCSLKKKSRNTLDVLKELAKQLHIPLKSIGFSGTKDKQAVTTQLISLYRTKKDLLKRVTIDNVTITPLGLSNEPLTLGDHQSNSFTIVVRNLTEIPEKKLSWCENYFDEQRFSRNNVAIGRALIKRNFSEATTLIESLKIKEHLEKYPNDYIGALKTLPLRMLKFYVHAYQSFLFNELLSQMVTGKEVPYSKGLFVFSNTQLQQELPLLGFGTPIQEESIDKKLIKILLKEKISKRDFIVKPFPELSQEGDSRSATFPIEQFTQSRAEPDNLNPGKQKIVLKFTLPKGCYATMVVRKLLC